MKDQLKNAYKPTPERFRYTVDSAVQEVLSQVQTTVPKKRLSKTWRAVIAVAVIAALIPTTVFGAGRLFELIADPAGEHGLSIGLDSTEACYVYPEYVKMHVNVPEGFAALQPFEDNMKFYSVSADEKFTSGFTLYPMRFDSSADMKEYIGSVESCKERVIDGHQAYEITTKNAPWSRLYVYYEDVNVFLLIYHKDVTDEQTEEFVKGITFTEGTADDHTEFCDPVDERPKDQGEYRYDERYTELPRDTEITFNDEGARYTERIAAVRVTDSVAGLDENDFNQAFPAGEIADQDGNLLPRTTNIIKLGDGFESVDEVLSSTAEAQSLILVDFAYENLTDADVEVCLPYRLNVFNKNGDGSLTRAEIIDEEQKIHASEYCDGEVVCMTPHGEGTQFYHVNLSASSALTVTVGYRCNTNMLDKAYLSLVDGMSMVESPVDEIDSSTIYCFKVQ